MDKKNTEIIDEIRNIFCEVLEIDNISNDHDFFDLGGNSLQALTLVGEVNNRFNLNYYIDTFFQNSSINKFSLKVYSDTSEKNLVNFENHENLVFFSPFDSLKKSIFFIHDGTGSLNGYINIINKIKADYNCIGLNFFHKEKYPVDISIEELSQVYTSLILEFSIGDNINLFGWSAGAKILLEIALQVEKMDKSVTGYMFDYPYSEEIISKSFDINSELLFIRNFIDEEEYKEIASLKKEDVKSFWEYIHTNENYHHKYPKLFLELESSHKTRILNNAQKKYIPDNVSTSQLFHFIPKDIAQGRLLSLFEEKIPVDGNHFTLLILNENEIIQKIRKNIMSTY